VPTIDLTDEELGAVTAAIRRTIEDDKFPHAPRLDPLRAALARFEAAKRTDLVPTGTRLEKAAPEPTAQPKGPPAAKGDKRARR
jgi:hypothetical protein